MNKLVAGQEIQVLHLDQWVNAKIIYADTDEIIVNYAEIDQISGPECSLKIDKDHDITLKIRLKMKTCQFKKGQHIQYKLKQDWVDAEITNIGQITKFITIQYNEGEKSEQVNECEYNDKIRIIQQIPSNQASECKDNDKDFLVAKERRNAAEDDTKLDATNEDDEIKSEPSTVDADDTKTRDSNVPVIESAGNKSWYQRIPGAETIETGINAAKSGIKSLMTSNAVKKKRTWDQKAIHQWNHEDVISWINSLKSAQKYCPDEFPKNFDGKELLEAEESDLILFINNTMYCKVFMKHLAKAKDTYATAPKLENEDEYEQDDEKETTSAASNDSASVIGIVGLKNLRNTCYMNTSIQILSQSPYITRYLAKRAKSDVYSDHPMLNAWIKLCDIIYNEPATPGYHTVYKPTNIRNALKGAHKDFGSGQQDDSSRALLYILQELDEEMGKERNAVSLSLKDQIAVQSKSNLSPTDIDKYVARLLDEHNPDKLASVLRKTFHGVELISIKCLECDTICNNFAIFSVKTLRVMSQRVKLKNVHVVHNDKYYSQIPEFSALRNCSVDVLKYHATDYLKTQHKISTSIAEDHMAIICISDNGIMTDIGSRCIADLQKIDGTVFVLINGRKASKKKKHYIFQLCLGVDGETSKVLKTKAGLCIKYTNYDQRSLYELVQREITAYNESFDDEKCEYYINYNDNIFSEEELETVGVHKSMHNNNNGINKLLLLRVHSNNTTCSYDWNYIDEEVLGEAEDDSPSCSQLQALNQYRNKKMKYKNNHKKKGRYERIKDEVDQKLIQIDQTIEAFQVKQNIRDISSKFLTISNKLKARPVTKHGRLTSLTNCIKEYEEARVFDESAMPHACLCKSGSGNSKWVRYHKQIVYKPPILLFHLDRYGDDTRNPASTPSYKRNDGYGGYSKNCGSTYSHSIHYNMKLEYDDRYNLYGVSNHVGSNDGGHYTATVHCLSDDKWYNVSDTNIRNSHGSATSHRQSATILAYVRDQKKKVST